MAEQNTSSAPGAPDITNKASKPSGILPKNAQTWLMAGIALVMITVIAFSGNPAAKTKTGEPISNTNSVVDPNQRRIQDYRQEIAEQTRKLNEEQARLEKAKQDFGAAIKQSGSFPNQAALATQAGSPPVVLPQGQPVVYAGQPAPPTTKSTIDSDKEKRDYTSLFASNVALSFRKEDAEQDPVAPLSGETTTQASALPAAPTRVPTGSSVETTAKESPLIPEGPSPTLRTSKKAGRPDDPNLQISPGEKYRVFEGTVLETVLTNRLAGEFSGPVNCMLTSNVFSHDHQKLLIPQGSRVLGEVSKVTAFGQQRLAVLFHRIIMPDGFSVSLDSFKGLNQIGETGLRDQVNHHYVQIFGTSLAIGAIAGLAQTNTRYGLNTSGVDNYEQGVSESLSQSSLRILDRFLNILPTFTIREGHRVKVYLCNDLSLPSYDHHKLPADL